MGIYKTDNTVQNQI